MYRTTSKNQTHPDVHKALKRVEDWQNNDIDVVLIHYKFQCGGNIFQPKPHNMTTVKDMPNPIDKYSTQQRY